LAVANAIGGKREMKSDESWQEAARAGLNIEKKSNVANGKPSAFPPEFGGKPARAILAQAALHSIIKLRPAVLDQYGVFNTMSKTIKKYQKYSVKINPILSKIVQPAALDILLEEVQKSRAKGQPRPPPQGSRPRAGFEGFLEAFTAESSLDESELSTEGVEDIVREALSESSFGLSAESFEAFLSSTESASENTDGAESTSASLAGLAEVAVLAEAALDAMMTLPVEVMQAEGIFDAVKTFIKVVTPTVFKYGPNVWSVINGAATVAGGVDSVMNIVKGKESAPDTGDAATELLGDSSEATIEKTPAAAHAIKHATVEDGSPMTSGVNGINGGVGLGLAGRDQARSVERRPRTPIRRTDRIVFVVVKSAVTKHTRQSMEPIASSWITRWTEARRRTRCQG
jgi:hypothetical protein